MGDEQLRPPVEVARPKPSPVVPGANRPAGSLQFTIKADGWRMIVFNLGGRIVLQTRAGRDVADRYPDIVEAARRLPADSAVDGELVAWKNGVFDFHQLSASPAARARAGAAVALLAFDVLAVAGRDVRRLPLAERWELLRPLVGAVGTPFELILATTDRDEAIAWLDVLAPAGVEGLVAKPLRGTYRPGTSGDWLKYRIRDTADAVITGLIGPPGRPRALRLELPDGRAITSNNLDGPQARHVATAVAEAGQAAGLAVEIRLGQGRHGTATFVRVRQG